MAKRNKMLHQGSSKKGLELYKPNTKRNYQPNADHKAAISEADFRIYLLQRHGLEIKIMRGDGNCLFRSIAHQLKLDPDQHYHIRSQVVDYMEEKQEFFSMFLEDDESWDDYISSMRASGTWGGYQELCAASQALNLAVHVFQWNDPKYVIQPHHDTNEDAAPPRVILLSFHDGCHYNSLVPADTSTLTAAGVSANMPLITNLPVKSSTNDASPGDVPRLTRNILQSMPWIELDEVMLALEWTDNIETDAIELLCSNISGIRLAIAAAAREQKASSSLSTNIASAVNDEVVSTTSPSSSSNVYISSDEQKKQSEDQQSVARPIAATAAEVGTAEKPKRFPKTKSKAVAAMSSPATEESKEAVSSAVTVPVVPSQRSRPMSKKEQRQKERQERESALKRNDQSSSKTDQSAAQAASNAYSVNLEDLMREIVI